MEPFLISGAAQCGYCKIYLPSDPPDESHAPCPNCGATTRNHNAMLVDVAPACEQFASRVKPAGATGGHKFRWELVDGYEFSRDDSGRLVYKFRLIDRGADYYTEVVQDAKTLEIIKAQIHRLSTLTRSMAAPNEKHKSRAGRQGGRRI